MDDAQKKNTIFGVYNGQAMHASTHAMYVQGHSNDERCRQAVNVEEVGKGIVDFKVLFGVCGLFHSDVS